MLTKNQIGVLYGVASVACFAMMDASVKWLDQFPVGEVLFARFFFWSYSNFNVGAKK